MKPNDAKFVIARGRPMGFRGKTSRPWTVWLPEGQRWISTPYFTANAQGAGVESFAAAWKFVDDRLRAEAVRS